MGAKEEDPGLSCGSGRGIFPSGLGVRCAPPGKCMVNRRLQTCDLFGKSFFYFFMFSDLALFHLFSSASRKIGSGFSAHGDLDSYPPNLLSVGPQHIPPYP